MNKVESKSYMANAGEDGGGGGRLVWVPDSVEGFAVAEIIEKPPLQHDDNLARHEFELNVYRRKSNLYLKKKKDELEIEVQTKPFRVKKPILDTFPCDFSLDEILNFSESKNCRNRYPADNVSLRILDPPSILNNLRCRYAMGQIYTYTGNVLLAINPYTPVTHLYTSEVERQYRGHKIGSLPPHPFAIAEHSHRKLVMEGMNQAVVVSGESGAGKTETSKILMQYLASAGTGDTTIMAEAKKNGWDVSCMTRSERLRLTAASCGSALSQGFAAALRKKILGANPIMESFGNARTRRNCNSSRFGRLTKLNFDRQGLLRGAGISTYLLESSRVVFHGQRERNYHIFYQFLEGASVEMLEKYGLMRSHSRYSLLCPYEERTVGAIPPSSMRNEKERFPSDEAASIPMVEDKNDLQDDTADADKDNFISIVQAMHENGLSEAERGEIFEIISGLIHLGQVNFLEVSDKKSDASHTLKCLHEDSAVWAARNLGFVKEELLHEISYKKFFAGGDEVSIVHSAEHAVELRNTLIKEIYRRLFDELVKRVNRSIEARDDISVRNKLLNIGILDIYGFEQLDINSFEQLGINLANERLQQFFVDKVLKGEQELYESEGLFWQRVAVPNSTPTIQAIQDIIYPKLDDHSRLRAQGQPREDVHLWQDIFNQVSEGGGKNIIGFCPVGKKVERTSAVSQRQFSPKKLTIFHYAGIVEYDLSGWLDKNNDKIAPQLQDLLRGSKRPLLRIFADSHTSSASGGGRKMGQFRSVGKKFLGDLSSMIAELGEMSLQFVRCLKPNSNMQPFQFDGSLVLSQMQQLGTFEMVKIMQKGYPNRITFSDLAPRYRKLLPRGVTANLHDRILMECVLHLCKVDRNLWVCGVSKLFMKTGLFAQLDSMLQTAIETDSLFITRLRKAIARKRLQICFRVVYICCRVFWNLLELVRKFRIYKEIAFKFMYRAFLLRKHLLLPLRQKVKPVVNLLRFGNIITRVMGRHCLAISLKKMKKNGSVVNRRNQIVSQLSSGRIGAKKQPSSRNVEKNASDDGTVPVEANLTGMDSEMRCNADLFHAFHHLDRPNSLSCSSRFSSKAVVFCCTLPDRSTLGSCHTVEAAIIFDGVRLMGLQWSCPSDTAQSEKLDLGKALQAKDSIIEEVVLENAMAVCQHPQKKNLFAACDIGGHLLSFTYPKLISRVGSNVCSTHNSLASISQKVVTPIEDDGHPDLSLPCLVESARSTKHSNLLKTFKQAPEDDICRILLPSLDSETRDAVEYKTCPRVPAEAWVPYRWRSYTIRPLKIAFSGTSRTTLVAVMCYVSSTRNADGKSKDNQATVQRPEKLKGTERIDASTGNAFKNAKLVPCDSSKLQSPFHGNEVSHGCLAVTIVDLLDGQPKAWVELPVANIIACTTHLNESGLLTDCGTVSGFGIRKYSKTRIMESIQLSSLSADELLICGPGILTVLRLTRTCQVFAPSSESEGFSLEVVWNDQYLRGTVDTVDVSSTWFVTSISDKYADLWPNVDIYEALQEKVWRSHVHSATLQSWRKRRVHLSSKEGGWMQLLWDGQNFVLENKLHIKQGPIRAYVPMLVRIENEVKVLTHASDGGSTVPNDENSASSDGCRLKGDKLDRVIVGVTGSSAILLPRKKGGNQVVSVVERVTIPGEAIQDDHHKSQNFSRLDPVSETFASFRQKKALFDECSLVNALMRKALAINFFPASCQRHGSKPSSDGKPSRHIEVK